MAASPNSSDQPPSIAVPAEGELAAGAGRRTRVRFIVFLMMFTAVVMMLCALETSRLNLVAPSALLIGLSLLVMNASVGAWGLNAVDLAPTPKSAAFVYGIYNGVLNLMGAYSSILVTVIANKFGFIWSFSSALIFMAVFLFGLVVVIDKHGIAPAPVLEEAGEAG